MNALAYAIRLLEALPALIAAGESLTTLIVEGSAALKNMQATHRDPTPAEWEALNAAIAALRSDLSS